MPSSSKKILFLSLSGIGNFLMQSPVFKAVKHAHPDWHITVWLAPRGTKALAEANPYIDAIIEAPIKASPLQHIQTTFELSKRKFNYGVVLSPGQLIKSSSLLFLAGIPNRVGHTYPWRGNSHNHLLLTKWIDEVANLHDIEQNLALLPLLDIPQPTGQIYYSLDIPDENKQQAKEWLEQQELITNEHLVGFHPGSAPNFPAKRWPLAHFAALGRELIHEQRAHILLFGGPDEQPILEKLHQNLGTSQSTFINTDLLTTAAIMQYCQFFVSNDSGLMHLAAASGVETFGLFGPSSEILTGPRGPHSHVIRAVGTHPVYSTELNYDLGQDSHESIQALKPEEVYQALVISR